MSKCLTPNDVDVLLHYYTSDVPHKRIDVPAVRESTDSFLRYGVIYKIGASDCYSTTPLGKAYVQAICSTPLPRMKYVCGLTGKVLDDAK